jgi:hypothetical protein
MEEHRSKPQCKSIGQSLKERPLSSQYAKSCSKLLTAAQEGCIWTQVPLQAAAQLLSGKVPFCSENDTSYGWVRRDLKWTWTCDFKRFHEAQVYLLVSLGGWDRVTCIYRECSPVSLSSERPTPGLMVYACALSGQILMYTCCLTNLLLCTHTCACRHSTQNQAYRLWGTVLEGPETTAHETRLQVHCDTTGPADLGSQSHQNAMTHVR